MEDERDELLMQKHALQLRLDKPIMPMLPEWEIKGKVGEGANSGGGQAGHL